MKNSFVDLCISDKCIKNQPFRFTTAKLIKNGYKTIAISTFITEESFNPKKGNKKKKGKQTYADIIPPPIAIPDIAEDVNLKILRRLTASFSDNETIQKVIKSVNIKKYDIFAVIPTTQKAFQLACTELDVDIISFDPEIKNPIKISRKLYNLALERGIHFEIMYGPAISDTTLRKNIINMSHLYHSYGKSKNIILTSWATNPNLIRGPYDLANLYP